MVALFNGVDIFTIFELKQNGCVLYPIVCPGPDLPALFIFYRF